MKCPDDGIEMRRIDYRGINLEECPRCRGRWFDRGELTKAKDKTDEDLRWLDFDPFQKEADKFRVPSEGRKCPACGNAMEALTYRNSGVVIDRCPACHGVWLHAGEFEKIIDFLEKTVIRKSAADYVKDVSQQLLEIIKDPAHPVAEIKDFMAALKLLEERIGAEHPAFSQAARDIFRRF